MDKKLRVIINGLGLGGTERHLAQILPILQKKFGWHIKVISLSNNLEQPYQTILESGIKVITPKNNFFSKIANNIINKIILLVKDFLQDRQTMTVFFLPEAYMLSSVTALLTNLPAKKIMSRRSLNNYQKRHVLLGKIEKYLHRFNHLFLSNSKAITKQLEEEGIFHNKIKIIYNGVNPDLYHCLPNEKQLLRSQYEIPPHTWVMVIVANLIPYKGHSDLLKALKIAAPQMLGKDWLLLCVGADTSGILTDLKSEAADYNLTNNIRWLGQCNEVEKILLLSDVGLLISHEEGFSNAIIEGMLAKLPMIVTAVGGNSEVVIDGKTGIIVPMTNAEVRHQNLAKAIVELFNQPENAEKMGQRGYERAIENFNVMKTCTSYNEIFENLLKI